MKTAEARRSEARARDAKWREAHPERARELSRIRSARWRSKNPEVHRESVRTHYWNNIESQKVNRSEYYQRNKSSLVEAARRYREKHHARVVLRAVMSRCEKRGIASDIDENWIAERLELGSELSGIPFVRGTRGNNPYAPSVDRKNPKLGYTRDNCRLILQAENMFKGVMDDAQLIFIAKKILEKQLCL